MQKIIFDKGIVRLAVSFPDKRFDGEVMWEFLNDLTDEQFIQAISKLCSSLKEIYPGTNVTALIREYALPSSRTLAGEAWGEVMREIMSTGSYGYPSFSDPLIHKAVDCIGWREICMSEKLAIERAHFLKIYEQLSERENKEKTEKQLTNKDIKELIDSITQKRIVKNV